MYSIFCMAIYYEIPFQCYEMNIMVQYFTYQYIIKMSVIYYSKVCCMCALDADLQRGTIPMDEISETLQI